jgi:hypothetical protein
MSEFLTTWSSFYANHAAVRTLVAFFHVGALIAGGGLAVASDRSLLTTVVDDDFSRRSLLESLEATHRFVIGALVLIVCSGLLLFASDYDTFLHSKFFWIKMALVAALTTNGALLLRAERRAMSGDERAWHLLRSTAIASITLWFLTTLGGVALPNIG